MKTAREQTVEHKEKVSYFIASFINELDLRSRNHDASKLEEPELSTFDIMTEKLAGSTYGSDEYKGFLAEMKPALDHHYANNSHHPEHFENGIDGMSLIDIVELFCDWKSATMRHKNGDINKSITINKDRFKISDQLIHIFENTVKEMEW